MTPRDKQFVRDMENHITGLEQSNLELRLRVANAEAIGKLDLDRANDYASRIFELEKELTELTKLATAVVAEWNDDRGWSIDGSPLGGLCDAFDALAAYLRGPGGGT